MTTSVRECSRFGPCCVLGHLVSETATKYIYRNRGGSAFVSKDSPTVHIAPCSACSDYQLKAA
jgi:hypothetical protein